MDHKKAVELDNRPDWKVVSSVEELREHIQGGSILDIEEFGHNGMFMVVKDSKGVMKVIDVFSDTWNYKPLHLAEHFNRELKAKRIQCSKNCKPFHIQMLIV